MNMVDISLGLSILGMTSGFSSFFMLFGIFVEEAIPTFHVPCIHPEITAGSLSMAPRLQADK